MNRIKSLIPVLLIALLTACGGGGGGNSGNNGSSALNDQNQSPADTTAPVITLSGDSPQQVELNAQYVEAGASADTGEDVVIDSSAVDTATIGSYTVTYNATDAAGNVATAVTRTVNVVDSSATATATKLSVLTSVVDDIIIPNYKNLSDEAAQFAATDEALATYCDAIGTADEAARLEDAQNSWKSLMQAAQKTELHIIGPAALNNKSLRNRVYFYQEKDNLVDTVSTCAVDAAVANADSQPDFEVAATSNNQRGLSAIEYLLFTTSLDHTCSGNVPAVTGWNALADGDKKAQRCALAELVAEDVAVNAEQIHSDWATYRGSFLNPDEIGTTFELMTDGLFYFEKYTKSAKLNGPLGIDALCSNELTCPDFIESPYSETSLENIKSNAEQLLAIFSSGLDELADQAAPVPWSDTFKDLINDVIDYTEALDSEVSLSDQVASITNNTDVAACESAFGSPDTVSALPICNLGGLVKRVTDDLKIEFITYLGVDLPEGAGGDTD